MRTAAFAVALAIAGISVQPAFAQFGQLDRITRRAQQVKKLADLDISDKDERAIGEQVSAKLVGKYGIYQDAGVARYVALVGTVLAQASGRPSLDWKFIVLDTDGVNAFAAPGGLVHVTRGALGLIKSEAELAGVLGHEIAHVTGRHTVRAIQKSNAVQMGASEAGASGGLTGAILGEIANKTYDIVINNKFDRGDENDADKVGITLANKVGYAPKGLADFLTHVALRNKGREEPNGLFASHPQIKDRLQRIAGIIRADGLSSSATVDARYGANIRFDAKPVAEIAEAADGTRGALGGGSKASGAAETKPGEKKEEPKKKRGFGLGALTNSLSSGKQAESTQASASAGGRMGVPDRDAGGGTNRTPVRVSISAADLAEFRKGIA